MEFKFKTLFAALAIAVIGLVSCKPDPIPGGEKPDDKPEAGFSNVVNSYENKSVSQHGSTVSIKFDAVGAWTASVKLNPEKDHYGKEWASVNENTLSGEAKNGATVRIKIEKNNASDERKVELWLAVEGYEPKLAATLTQAPAGETADAAMNEHLNTFMHNILLEDYLWNEEYAKLGHDLTVPYNEFLSDHLLALGEVNIEDGGYYKAVQANSGQRFIYSSLVEVQPVTRAAQVAGLGFGPFLSTALSDGGQEMGIAPAYVRRGSPAEKAGLRRGDIIYAVNGQRLTTANYRNYMSSLYYNPAGGYNFDFLRFEANDQGGYSLNAFKSGETAYAGAHIFDPVLFASVLKDQDNEATKIGYLVYETFDVTSQEFLVETIEQFAAEGITDLILDLRFNYGGAVAQSRWLSGCIAGEANWDKTFCTVEFNDGETENWTFGKGYTTETDNLGLPKDLKLNRLWVIGSYNTASAAELVINSLRGIDFEVRFIGSQTEGKNVGMNVSQVEYRGRHFNFQPITFWVKNAKGFGDYKDGFLPDANYAVNNDNASMSDDYDNVFPYSFADWGNMDYNIALQWAYCDITGKPRWSKEPNTKSVSGFDLTPVDFQQMEIPADKAGNLIFNN